MYSFVLRLGFALSHWFLPNTLGTPARPQKS